MKLVIACTLHNASRKAQHVIVDLIVHFVKANGGTSPKVFKVAVVDVAAGDNVSVFRAPPLAQQEAITLLPDDSGFLYDSEAARKAETFPLHKVTCTAR